MARVVSFSFPAQTDDSLREVLFKNIGWGLALRPPLSASPHGEWCFYQEHWRTWELSVWSGMSEEKSRSGEGRGERRGAGIMSHPRPCFVFMTRAQRHPQLICEHQLLQMPFSISSNLHFHIWNLLPLKLKISTKWSPSPILAKEKTRSILRCPIMQDIENVDDRTFKQLYYIYIRIEIRTLLEGLIC